MPFKRAAQHMNKKVIAAITALAFGACTVLGAAPQAQADSTKKTIRVIKEILKDDPPPPPPAPAPAPKPVQPTPPPPAPKTAKVVKVKVPEPPKTPEPPKPHDQKKPEPPHPNGPNQPAPPDGQPRTEVPGERITV